MTAAYSLPFVAFVPLPSVPIVPFVGFVSLPSVPIVPFVALVPSVHLYATPAQTPRTSVELSNSHWACRLSSEDTYVNVLL